MCTRSCGHDQLKSILITGSNGLLGNKLVSAATGRYRVVGLDLQSGPYVPPAPAEYIQGDVSDRERIFGQLREKKPDVVLHAAAFTDVDACESQYETAYAVNVRGTECIADACKRLGISLIHLSTDYVFDGARGPYAEDDKPCPLSAYGKMKWESERIVSSLLPDAVIARTMVLFGYAPHVRKNFVTWLIEKLGKRETVRVVNDQFGTPTFADDLAEALLALFEKGVRGIYHTAGSDYLDRHAFAVRIADVFGLDKSLIAATTSDRFVQPAPRPKKSGLKTQKLERDTGFRFRPLSGVLSLMKNQMESVHGG